MTSRFIREPERGAVVTCTVKKLPLGIQGVDGSLFNEKGVGDPRNPPPFFDVDVSFLS